MKISIAVTLAVILTPIIVLGPALPSVQKHYRENAAKDPNAPARFLQIASVQNMTFREEEAQKTLEEFYMLFMKDDYDTDDIPESNVSKYYKGDDPLPDRWCFWIPIGEDADSKPAPVQAASKEQVGEAMSMLADMLEDKREYPKSSHLYTLLKTFYEPGTLGRKAGDDGHKRMLMRQF
ncbi:MAG TPA: hypothetical protein DEA08_00035 [Planctomycetes bacterium]|nr:hypothetical protein [Planctomycetota bacterium]